jgi:hypothetical protein
MIVEVNIIFRYNFQNFILKGSPLPRRTRRLTASYFSTGMGWGRGLNLFGAKYQILGFGAEATLKF